MKKLLACLSIVFLLFAFSGMATADTYTFNFNPSALPDNSNAATIGTYMTGIYGSTVLVTGGNVQSETGLLTLLGGINDGYLESEPNGAHLIQINFGAVPITSVSFDWGKFLDQFDADYSLNGTTWTNFFDTGYSVLSTGHFNTLTFGSPVVALRFHDNDTGEVGIDNLIVNSQAVPEPATMLLLGLGLLGVAGIRRKFKK